MIRAFLLSALVLILFIGPECFVECFIEDPIPPAGSGNDEALATEFLGELNTRAMNVYSKSSCKAWDYNTSITKYKREQMDMGNLESASFSKELSGYANAFDQTGFSSDIERQLDSLRYIGSAALPDEELEELENILSGMESRYSTGKPCEAGTCYSLEPDLTRLMATSHDYSELYRAWNAWPAEVGAPAREDYTRYVELKNRAALANDPTPPPPPPSVFPPSGTYRVPPNSVFEIIYGTMENGEPSIIYNGTEITDSNDEAYRLLKNESLDCTRSLVHLSILILDDTDVTFTESNLKYSIEPYDTYTDNETDQRCKEWEDANEVHLSLNEEYACKNASSGAVGSFSSNILLKKKLVQNCETCAYNDCTYKACTDSNNYIYGCSP